MEKRDSFSTGSSHRPVEVWSFMSQKIRIAILSLFLIYSFSLLLGRLEVYQSGGEQRSEERFLSGPDDGAQMNHELSLDGLEKQGRDKVEQENPRLVVAPGLIHRVLKIQYALKKLDDPLLENDARPDRFFRNLERSYTLNLFLLSLTVTWFVLLALTILSVLQNRWFSSPMILLVLTPSLLALFAMIFFKKGTLIFAQDDAWTFSMVLVYLDMILLFAGAYLISHESIPDHPVTEQRDARFMEHMVKSRVSILTRVQKLLKIFSHIVIIGVVALVVSNLVLLPIYVLQENFPAFFAFFLILVLIALGIFYVMSYNRVSIHSTGENQYWTALSFLGFRFLNNALFLTLLAGVIFLILGLVVVVTLVNVGLLQSFELLQRPRGI